VKERFDDLGAAGVEQVLQAFGQPTRLRPAEKPVIGHHHEARAQRFAFVDYLEGGHVVNVDHAAWCAGVYYH
jgi:hypothetical protein